MYQGKCYGGPRHGETVSTMADRFMVCVNEREIEGGKAYDTVSYQALRCRDTYYYLAKGYELTAADRQELGMVCSDCPEGASGPWCNGCPCEMAWF